MKKIKRYMYPENPDFCAVKNIDLDLLEAELATAKRRYDEIVVAHGGTAIYGTEPRDINGERA